MIKYNKYGVVRRQIFIDAIANGVGALVGAVASRKNNKDNIKMQRETNQMQMDMFQRQLDYNLAAEKRARGYALEDFAMENEYNSPAAQRARYEAAGLNPALMMQGQGSAVGQIEATGGAQAPAAPHLDAPHSENWFSGVQRSVVDVVNSYFDNRIKEEQAEQLGIDNQTRSLDNIIRINEAVARIDKILTDKNLSDAQRRLLLTQRKDLENRIKLFLDTYDDQKRGIKWDTNMKIAQWNQINADTKKALTEERILRIEESYKAAIIESGIRLSNAQVRSISQGIAESVERIEDMRSRRHDDFMTSRELRSKVRKEAELVVRQRLNLDPGSEFGKRQLRLIESEIYDKMRVPLPFGVRSPHPVTWFNDDYIRGK